MCGIAGWIGSSLNASDCGREAADRALTALAARGPDGQGVARGAGWLLVHTRLAILDLSERGSQPMSDGRGGWLVYNGEIYNFRELRSELTAKGVVFRSSGDAEVLLHAMREWGPACLPRLRGMFAFAWLDASRQRLVLARDRYGVKPLAYEVTGGELTFASDLFGLQALRGAPREVDSEAAYLYLALGYVPAPHSIAKNVRKVRPGHYLEAAWSEGGVTTREDPYWSLADVAPAGQTRETADADEEYEAHMSAAVRLRLISDVPVGSLLSGGIDSSLVTMVAREQHGAAIPSFTMGFDDAETDESPFARAVAERLGGHHTECRLAATDPLALWNDLWNVYDEPFADSSALPMVGLSRQVASRVKVALSGDGGDEVFCGYPWHRALDRAEGLTSAPALLRRGVGAAVAMLSPSRRYAAAVAAAPDRVGQWSALRTGVSDATCRTLPVRDAASRPPMREYFERWGAPIAAVADPLDWACRMDLLTYLPDDLMVKSDRAGMRVGLELREPLLDHELTTWCLQQPIAYRYDRTSRISKLPSRRALGRRLPPELYERPKRGFTPPLHRWVDGPLRPIVVDAVARLERGELAPLCLAAGMRTWSDCARALDDRHDQFLWRVVCYAGWSSSYNRRGGD